MLRPTNDPIDMMRRQQAEMAREMRESQGASGTENYQTVRRLKAQVDAMQELIIRMPTYEGRQVDVDSWTPPTSGWKTIASATIPRPADKTRVVVSANGFITALASSQVLGFRARIMVNGVASEFMDGTVEGSTFLTRSSAFPSFVREIAPLTTSVTVQLQISAAGTYTSDQRASLSVLAGFSTI